MSKLTVGDFANLPKLEDQPTVGGTKEVDAKANLETIDHVKEVGKIEEVYSGEKEDYEISDETVIKKTPLKEEPTLYNNEELEEVVKSIAGSFFAVYISKYHPSQLQKGAEGIRISAADEIIQFSKTLLQRLKKESL